MQLKFVFTLIILVYTMSITAQKNSELIIPKDSLYLENIKKSKLYGVYIPRDIDDAMVKLMELTDENARRPLKDIDEETMAKKLYFGLGRWMEYNWNFEEGSRFSHYLRLKGLYYTEDMTRFMLTIFHRHINKKPLDSEKLITQFNEQRQKKIKEEQSKMEILRSEKKKKSSN